MTATMGLLEAIDDALARTNNGTTHEVIDYLQTHHRKVLDENAMTIENNGLGQLIRGRRKKPDPVELVRKNESLCFDFGLDYLDLDDEISVPIDMENVLNSPCDWPQMDDATIEDIDKHLILRDAQEAVYAARTLAVRTLRHAAARVVPGRTDIPLRELRVIAYKRRD